MANSLRDRSVDRLTAVPPPYRAAAAAASSWRARRCLLAQLGKLRPELRVLPPQRRVAAVASDVADRLRVGVEEHARAHRVQRSRIRCSRCTRPRMRVRRRAIQPLAQLG